MADQVAQLEARIAELERRLMRAEDIEAIRRLQYQYGYYLDKTLYEEVAELFADEGARVHFLHGVFHGKDGVRRLYCGRFMHKFADGHNGPRYGQLLDHPQMQGVITLSDDGLSAHGRFRSIMSAGTHESLPGERQWWEGGIYENEYVKQDGQWRIKVLNWRGLWQADFSKGWAKAPLEYDGWITEVYPDDPHGPDEIVDDWGMYPRTEIVPFHYDHPVTGAKVTG